MNFKESFSESIFNLKVFKEGIVHTSFIDWFKKHLIPFNIMKSDYF